MPRAEEGEAGQTLVEAAASVLAARRGDIPRDFLIELFERAAPDDLVRYSPEELAGIGEQSWSFLLQREAGGAKIAFRPVHSGASTAVLEILNDDMPFLVDLVLGELGERGLDIRLLVHPVFSVERDQAGRLIAFKGLPARRDGHRESFIHIHVAGVDDEKERADILRALERCWPMCGSRCRIGGRCWRAPVKSPPNSKPIRRRLRPTRSPRRSSSCNGSPPTISRCSAPATTPTRTTDTELVPEFETGLGLLRSPDMRLLRRGNQLVTMTPEIREFLKEPKLLIMTKAAVRSRIHRRVHLDYVGVKRFDPDGHLVGECVSSGCLTSTAYTRSVRAIPYLRRKVDARHRPRRLRPGEPFRQGAGQRAGTLSARRTVPDRRGHALSVRDGDHAARRAPARAGAAAARPLRPFRLGAGLHPARPLRSADPGARSATISPPRSADGCAPSIRSSRKARWCACTSSSAAPGAKPRTSIAQRWSTRSKPSCAAGPTRSATRWRPATPAQEARALFGALSRGVLGRLSRGLSGAAGGSPISRSSSG